MKSYGEVQKKYTKICMFYCLMRISGMRRFFDHIVISTSNRCESSRELSKVFLSNTKMVVINFPPF
jgi:hypothetical protein